MYKTWLSYSNWLENSRVYSEIIQVEENFTLTLYYESFATGGGSVGRINQSNQLNEIVVQDDENRIQSIASMTNIQDDEEKKMQQRGFRFQLIKVSIIEIMIL